MSRKSAPAWEYGVTRWLPGGLKQGPASWAHERGRLGQLVKNAVLNTLPLASLHVEAPPRSGKSTTLFVDIVQHLRGRGDFYVCYVVKSKTEKQMLEQEFLGDERVAELLGRRARLGSAEANGGAPQWSLYTYEEFLGLVRDVLAGSMSLPKKMAMVCDVDAHMSAEFVEFWACTHLAANRCLQDLDAADAGKMVFVSMSTMPLPRKLDRQRVLLGMSGKEDHIYELKFGSIEGEIRADVTTVRVAKDESAVSVACRVVGEKIAAKDETSPVVLLCGNAVDLLSQVDKELQALSVFDNVGRAVLLNGETYETMAEGIRNACRSPVSVVIVDSEAPMAVGIPGVSDIIVDDCSRQVVFDRVLGKAVFADVPLSRAEHRRFESLAIPSAQTRPVVIHSTCEESFVLGAPMPRALDGNIMSTALMAVFWFDAVPWRPLQQCFAEPQSLFREILGRLRLMGLVRAKDGDPTTPVDSGDYCLWTMRLRVEFGFGVEAASLAARCKNNDVPDDVQPYLVLAAVLDEGILRNSRFYTLMPHVGLEQLRDECRGKATGQIGKGHVWASIGLFFRAWEESNAFGRDINDHLVLLDGGIEVNMGLCRQIFSRFMAVAKTLELRPLYVAKDLPTIPFDQGQVDMICDRLWRSYMHRSVARMISNNEDELFNPHQLPEDPTGLRTIFLDIGSLRLLTLARPGEAQEKLWKDVADSSVSRYFIARAIYKVGNSWDINDMVEIPERVINKWLESEYEDNGVDRRVDICDLLGNTFEEVANEWGGDS